MAREGSENEEVSWIYVASSIWLFGFETKPAREQGKNSHRVEILAEAILTVYTVIENWTVVINNINVLIALIR